MVVCVKQKSGIKWIKGAPGLLSLDSAAAEIARTDNLLRLFFFFFNPIILRTPYSGTVRPLPKIPLGRKHCVCIFRGRGVGATSSERLGRSEAGVDRSMILAVGQA